MALKPALSPAIISGQLVMALYYLAAIRTRLEAAVVREEDLVTYKEESKVVKAELAATFSRAVLLLVYLEEWLSNLSFIYPFSIGPFISDIHDGIVGTSNGLIGNFSKKGHVASMTPFSLFKQGDLVEFKDATDPTYRDTRWFVSSSSPFFELVTNPIATFSLDPTIVVALVARDISS